MNEITKNLAVVFANALEGFRDTLLSRGIEFRTPEHQILDDRPDHFSSEVRVYFFKGDNLIDVFEFFIYRDGIQLVTEEDLTQWVNQQINSVGH